MTLTQLLFSFKGRIRQLHWWVATLAAGATASILTGILEAAARSSAHAIVNPMTHQFEPTGIFGAAVSIIALANAWIAFALSVKRLHDRDRTGWWLLWQLVVIVLAVFLTIVAVAVPQEQAPVWYALAGGAVLAARSASCEGRKDQTGLAQTRSDPRGSTPSFSPASSCSR